MGKITSTLWRRFEKVVFLAIKSILEDAKLDTIQEKLTEPTQDGGYDGSFLIPCIMDKDRSSSNGYYKILFEAKLRSDLDKDLPLNDFSKSLIIAINMDSDALIVATNLRLSDGTKEHLANFSHKTGLRTYYLSPYYVDTWMKEHYSLDNQDSDKELRNLLRNASAYSSLQQPLELLKKEPLEQAKELPQLLGSEKKRLLTEIIQEIKNSNGIVLIKGNAGTGKSFFCSHLASNLEKIPCSVYSIDLKNYQTPRVLFLKLLETLWHIPFEALLSFDRSSLEKIVEEVDSHRIDENIKEAVLAAFSRDLNHYSQNADILNYYMIQYLLNIYAIRTRHANIVLYFSNINSISPQMVDFLLQFLNEYSFNGKAVLELRTSTYIDVHMESGRWEKYIKQFSSLEKILCQRTIKEFSPSDAYRYIRITLDDVELDVPLMDAILHVTGRNPLFLGSLVEYLNITGLVKNLPREAVLHRLSHLIVDDKRQIISMLINAFCEKGTFFAEFFELIRIFQISIKESYVALTLSDYQINYIDQLIDANLIYRNKDVLSVVHPLQLECILKNHSLMDSVKRMLARKILDTLNDITLSADHSAMIQIRCYRILHEHQKVVELAYPLSIGLLENAQYTLCYKYAKEALEKIEIFDSEYQKILHLKILRLLVEICIYQEEDSIFEIDDYMEKLNYAVSLWSSRKDESSDYIIFQARYYMTKNRYEHFTGQFGQAFDTLTEALEFAKNHKEQLGNQIIGNIQLEYAIALKEKENLVLSIGYLKECLELQPDNPELLFTYHTQMYELLLLDDPKAALGHTEENRLLCTKLNIATKYHNEVHWLNAQYYLRNYDICFTEAALDFKIVEQMGLKNEEGRLANLIGNIYFQNKDFKNAKVYYKFGIDLFQGKGYISNIWSLMINMSSLLAELMDEEAADYIRTSIHILAQSYRERIMTPSSLPGYYEKLHVAVVILYFNIRKLERVLAKEIIESLLSELSENLLAPKTRDELFQLSCKKVMDMMKNTPHCHSSYLLLGN